MRLKKFIARVYRAFSRWTPHTPPLPEKFIAIGAPHTSNWDAIFMLAALWGMGSDVEFLVKDGVVKVPLLGALVRRIGGITVDRSHHHGLVAAVVAHAASASTFHLVLTPSGTRKPVTYWKSGFYRMALATHLPIKFGFIDRRTHTYGWTEEEFFLTGNVEADMDHIRSVYAGMEGVRGTRPEPRLRAEDDAAARTRLLKE
ncbi:1-acyl-sn-glycerol-3-phosphate acyltransferase [Neoactinobaculum massilliense]|uniref:1-acyl-sn-glycerol-3-phosphate acyltransferase n=1 Tax=Neoactinobaculum massilliense TaxID=2364794 RepID=UPI000F52E286|nr:1-acyl-sn-glycerol-3-phosphate acyltransferase [Neoactinobaculum massilliense]